MSKQAEEDVFRAVLVADHFDACFECLDTTHALLPFAGFHLVDYTLEFLSRTEVREVLVVTVHRSEEMAAHLRTFWTHTSLPLKIKHVHFENVHSVGGIVRELDAKGVLKSDFLLLQAGVVGNADLRTAIAEHKKRRVKDKSSVMTLMLMPCHPNNPTRIRGNDLLVLMDGASNRVLHYQKLTESRSKYDIPVECYEEHPNVEVRFDLLDCNVAICSNQVPLLFTENFDTLTRHDLITEVLGNEEITGQQIHAHVLDRSYAAFVSDYNTYLSISHDVLSRWTHPVVPDGASVACAHENQSSKFTLQKRLVYLSDSVKISSSARVQDNCLVGPGTVVGNESIIINSVIASGCRLGNKVVVQNSIIWDGVELGDHVQVKNSIVCAGVTVASSSDILDRSILCNKVSLTKPVKLTHTVLTSEGSVRTNSDAVVTKYANLSNVYVWTLKGSGQSTVDVWPEWHALELPSPGDLESNASDLSELDEYDDALQCEDVDLEDTSPVQDDKHVFWQEILESLKRSIEDNADMEHLYLEINGSKCAHNIGVNDRNRLVCQAVLEMPRRDAGDATLNADNYLKCVRPLLERFLPLFLHYFVESRYQKDCLQAIEQCASDATFRQISVHVLKFLYDNNVLAEEVILAWNRDMQNKSLKEHPNIMNFMRWLEEAEEESSDEEE